MNLTHNNAKRVQDAFIGEKLICFGRYALQVPKNAELLWGRVAFPATITIMNGGEPSRREWVDVERERIKKAHKTAEILYDGAGSVPGSWQLGYYEDVFSRQYNLFFLDTYITISEVTYLLADSTEGEENKESVFERQALRAQLLRRRNDSDVPRESGYCIEAGFLGDSRYNHQEVINAGIFIPGFDDVTLSVSSNKNAYADYSREDWNRLKSEQLPLLARIKAAQNQQGTRYPTRTVLRLPSRRTVRVG